MAQNNSGASDSKRVFGWLELVFDSFYLIAAFGIGIFLLLQAPGQAQKLAALMAFILAIGDSFHLIPRMMAVISGDSVKYVRPMGWGKLISSISMTVFYVLLWQFGLVRYGLIPSSMTSLMIYLSAAVRIILCLFPQNGWLSQNPPLNWAIWRNLPFVILGAMVAGFYFTHRTLVPSLSLLWLAILLSFAFYLPVVLFSEHNRKLGMLMLPKTCMYIWMLLMLLSTIS